MRLLLVQSYAPYWILYYDQKMPGFQDFYSEKPVKRIKYRSKGVIKNKR
jgi:hypothetical protein